MTDQGNFFALLYCEINIFKGIIFLTCVFKAYVFKGERAVTGRVKSLLVLIDCGLVFKEIAQIVDIKRVILKLNKNICHIAQ